MSNKSLGNKFEQILCDKLSEFGFWVHNMAQNKAGQPADIIAVRNGKAYLIDAKVCSKNMFPFSRIEENQDLAMDLWRERGNGIGWFALLLGDKVYMLSHYFIKSHRNLHKGLSTLEILEFGEPLEMWVMKCK